MAASPQVLLAQRHRSQQALIGSQASTLTRTLWGYLVKGPGRGTDEWLDRAKTTIRAQAAASTGLARAYYGLSRRTASPKAPPLEYATSPLVEEALVASLVGTGLKRLSEALEAGSTLEEALAQGGESAAAAAARIALSGGRRLIQDTARGDPVAVGYFWQTREDGKAPCHWCAMLASRGPVYKADSWLNADPRPHGELKVHAHDNCFCHLSPVWRRGQELPPLAVSLKADWEAVTKSANGMGKMRAWRSWYDAQQRQGAVDLGAA